MDYLRSCYGCMMRFRSGDPPRPVVWYFAPAGSLPMPIFNPFFSRNWDSRAGGDSGDDLGEVPGTRVWLDGSIPDDRIGLNGDALASECAIEHEDWWGNGLGPGEHSGPYDELGRPLCCLRPAESECSPTPPFNCVTISDTLNVAVSSQSTPCMTGDQTVTATRFGPGVCVWLGAVETFAGTSAFELAFDGTTWTFGIDCFLGPVAGVVVSFTSSPFLLVIDVPDDTWCCSPGGGGGIRLTITLP